MVTVALYDIYYTSQTLPAEGANCIYGLYRDDGLAVMSQADRIRKNQTKIVKNCGLNITAQTNVKMVNYLDVTLDLNTPYTHHSARQSTTLCYQQALKSPSVNYKQPIPKAISKRVSEISSNHEIFQKAAPIFNQALQSAGHENTVQYDENPQQNKRKRKKNRTRKVILTHHSARTLRQTLELDF